MFIGSLNVRSLLPSYQNIKEIILSNNFDAFTICETWLNETISNEYLNIDGFQIYRIDRNTRGGGVLIFIKNNFRSEVINIQGNFCEQLWINIQTKNKNIALGIIYKPPNQEINNFLIAFEESLSIIFPTVDEIICCGDFNINLFDYGNNNVEKFFSVLDSFGLCQVIDAPTRITDSTSSLLDLIICREEVVLEKGVIETNHISDHQLVYCKLNLNEKVSGPKMHTYRNFKNFNEDNFQRDLFNIPFFRIFDQETVDEKVNFLVNCLINLFDIHAPMTTSRITKPKAHWLTNTIREMMSLRDKALRRYKKTKSVAHFQFYKEMRNYVNKAIQREKRAFFTYQFNNCKPNETWKILKNNCMLPEKTKDIPENIKNVTEINNFFINSIPVIQPPEQLLGFYKNNCIVNSEFSFMEINDLFVYETICSIKSNATGCDELNIKLIKLCCPFIIPYITHVVNFCFQENVYPTEWKNAIVRVLPKKSNPSEYKDLRAISILPTLSKIIERAMEVQLRNHLTNFDLLPPVQSGFRKGYSCATALLHVVDDIIRATDRGDCTVLVLLDFSRAFDTINYDILLAILQYMGLSENSINLLENYLKNRQQKVCIDGVSSCYLNLNSGVPQGSILGPLLFSIYTFNLMNSLQHCKAHFYADDTQIYYSFPPQMLLNACMSINNDLESFIKTATDHCLIINPIKSNVLTFGTRINRQIVNNNINIKINNSSLEIVDQAKNLGLLMDCNLRFEKYINNIIHRSYFSLKLIYGIRHYLTLKIKLMLCESLVLSKFNYADTVYGPNLTSQYKRKIQTVQNSCLRLIFGVRRLQRISHKLKNAGWLNMENRRIMHAAILFHKIIINKMPSYLHRKITFRTDIHNINIRFKTLLTPPKFRTEFFKRSFTYQICKIYNFIPQLLKTKNIHSFKIKFKSFLLNKQQ